MRRLRSVASDICPVAVFHSGDMMGGYAILAESPSLSLRRNRPLGRTKWREALRRRRRRCVSPLRNSPSRRKRKRRPHIKKKKSPLLRSRHGYFPGAAGRTRGEIPSRAKNLIEALAWRSRPGCFSGGSDHEGGENTSGGRKSSTSCHVGSVATVIFSA